MTEYETQSIALLKAILEAQINLIDAVSSQVASGVSKVNLRTAKRKAKGTLKSIKK